MTKFSLESIHFTLPFSLRNSIFGEIDEFHQSYNHLLVKLSKRTVLRAIVVCMNPSLITGLRRQILEYEIL